MTPFAQKLLDREAAAPRRGQSCDAASPARAAAPAPAAAAPLSAALAAYPYHMTVADVAEYFGISTSAVLLFRDNGQLGFVNIGCGSGKATWRILRHSVAEFERKHQVAPLKIT
jgi:hypothetical protein